MLLLLAFGWTIRYAKMNDFELFFPVFTVDFIFNVIVGALTAVNKGSATKYHDFEGIQGNTIIVFRILVLIGFFVGIFLSRKEIEQKQVVEFYWKIGACGSIYLLSFPFMILIVDLFQHTARAFVIEFGMISISLICVGVMLR